MSDLDNPVDPREHWQREHVRRYVETDGREGHEWRPGVPTLLLTTRGRRSGTARRSGLIYGCDDDRYVVVASKGGSDEDPDWLRNLVADGRVRVQVRADTFDARARVATPEEKARLWPTMVAIWPAYEEYRAKTDRDIPVVIIERTDPGPRAA